MYKVVACLLFSLFTFPAFATTIVPFENLGIMAKKSQAVVLVEVLGKEDRFDGAFYREFSQLKIQESLQPGLAKGDVIEIKNLHKWNGNLECMIWGDLILEEGHTYLLFLQQNEFGEWQPLMLSYGALQVVNKSGKELLVPFDLGTETHVLKTATGSLAEPLLVYDKVALLDHLKKVMEGEANWDQEKVKADPPLQNELLQERAAPSHCTYLGAPAPYPRWNNFPTALPTYYTTGGDPGCASSITKIQGALSDLNSNYSGLNLTDGGTHSFSPDCSSGANGSQFTNFVDNNYGQRSITIQFDDPCDEIADLSGCSGTLAIGGLYWFFSTHTWDGVDWNNGAYGYVLVNNGVGTCYCNSGSDYDLMIVHELTHTLGIGHISPGDGVANMNPSCCNTIQSLDIECLDYTYLSALPVELVVFSGKKEGKKVELSWQTASEINNDKFIVERAGADGIYAAIGTIEGAGNAFQTNHYYFDDENPLSGINYYRLKQVDFDGSVNYSDQIVVDNFLGLEARVFPNPVKNEEATLVLTSEFEGAVQISVVSLEGKILWLNDQYLEKGTNNFQLTDKNWAPGVYFIKLETATRMKVIRMMVE